MPFRKSNSGAGRILIVEDDVVTREFFAESLLRHGYIVEVEGDGLSALKRIGETPFDLIILDLHLPEMEGGSVMASLEQRWPDLLPRIIVVTGLQLHEITDTFPVCAVLAKPVSEGRLLEQVRACMPAHDEPGRQGRWRAVRGLISRKSVRR